MKKYALTFALAYFVLSALCGAISMLLQVGSSAFTIATTIGASFAAAWHFGKEQQRRPSKTEKSHFAWLALAGMWLASLFLAAIAWVFIFNAVEAQLILDFFAQQANQTWFTFILIAVIASSALYYWVIRWSFAWYINRRFPAVTKT
jgi:magnesium-transporting ATPase (P-type)